MCELWLGGGGVVWPRPLGSFDRQVGWVEGGGASYESKPVNHQIKARGGGGLKLESYY